MKTLLECFAHRLRIGRVAGNLLLATEEDQSGEQCNGNDDSAHIGSLKRLRNSVVRVRRKKQVLREIHFHAVALPNRDGGGYLYEAVKDSGGRLRNTARSPVRECLGSARCNGPATLSDLACSGNHAQGDRRAEDLKVVVVDLILEPCLSNLIEALELVEIDGLDGSQNY